MAGNSNKNKEKDPAIDEVLEETPPDINQPQNESLDEELEADIIADPDNEELIEEEPIEPVVEETPEVVEEKVEEVETPDQKEQRYKSQQVEAQIQVERNKALTDKVEEAATVTATEDELKEFVKQDGVEWDQLTNFEQAMAKRTYLSEKKFNIVHESVKTVREVDEWAKKVDDFIDSTDGKPEFIDLSSHEADFRKYSLKESHRGTPIDVLLAAFLHNMPKEKPKRDALFNTTGGGEKEKPKSGITDADKAADLRKNNPKEYKRQLKAGKIKLEI